MADEVITFPLTKGMERGVVPCKSDLASFYTLSNLRPTLQYRGQLEQTPRFKANLTYNQGTYNTGAGNVTESTTSSILWEQSGSSNMTGTVTGSCIFRGATTQQKVFQRVTTPSGTGVTKCCLLKIVSTTAVTVTLGNLYEVVIDGATTFKWRVNGGAYTTLVAIDATNGNLIDGGAVHLYWLASSGFTVTDTWSWRRSDTHGGVGSFMPHVLFDDKLYFITSSYEVFVMENPENAANNCYARPVGYQTVYARNLIIYENHLLLLGVDVDGNASGVKSLDYVRSSDLNNYDCFTATDTNEADMYLLPLNTENALATLTILDGCVLGGRVFIITSAGIFFSDYAGLPIPMAFKKLCQFQTPLDTYSGGVLTPKGFYFNGNRNIFFFDGNTVQSLVDLVVYDTALGSNINARGACWHSTKEEVIFYIGDSFLVFQERFGTFYLRSCSFSTTVASIMSMISTGELSFLMLGTSSRKTLKEDVDWSGVPVNDAASGASFASPTLITQCIGQTASFVKELKHTYVAATPYTSALTNYSVAGYIKLTLSWFVSTDGLISGSPSTHASAIWTSAQPDGLISFPRVAFRFLALQLAVTGTNGTKPPGPLTLQSLEAIVSGMTRQTAR